MPQTVATIMTLISSMIMASIMCTQADTLRDQSAVVVNGSYQLLNNGVSSVQDLKF